MDEALNRLIDLMESTAPEVWMAAMKQVQAMIIQHACFASVSAIMLVASFVVFAYAIRRYSKVGLADQEDYALTAAVSCVAGIGSLIIMAYTLSKLAGLLIAPEYQAIQALIDLVQ